MMGHHVLTIALFGIAHRFHVQRMGFLVLALLNFSNPFMHSAKVLNYLGQPPSVKTPAFVVFGLSFAISRCVIFPMMLKTSLDAVLEHVRAGDNSVIKPAVVCFLGLGALQLLQFYWLHRIVRCDALMFSLPAFCLAALRLSRPLSWRAWLCVQLSIQRRYARALTGLRAAGC